MKYADRSISSNMIRLYIQDVTLFTCKFPVVSSPAGMDDYLKSPICHRRRSVFLLVIPLLANHHPSLWHLWFPPLAEPARLKNSCKMLRRNSRITAAKSQQCNNICAFESISGRWICNNYFKTDRECRYSDLFYADDSLMLADPRSITMPCHCIVPLFH